MELAGSVKFALWLEKFFSLEDEFESSSHISCGECL